jgi:hypothetical protein
MVFIIARMKAEASTTLAYDKLAQSNLQNNMTSLDFLGLSIDLSDARLRLNNSSKHAILVL